MIEYCVDGNYFEKLQLLSSAGRESNVYLDLFTYNMPMCIMLTYIITGLLYTVIFYIFAYLKTIEIKYSIYIGISSFIIGLVITLINITLIYYITNKKVKQWET